MSTPNHPTSDSAIRPSEDQKDHTLAASLSSGSGKSDLEQQGVCGDTEDNQSSDWPVNPEESFSLKLRRLCRWMFFGFWVPASIREILRECRSLPSRIKKTHEAKLYRRGVSYGFLQGDEQARLQNALTLDCTTDTQETVEVYRWATLLDQAMFVRAWRLGAKSALAQIVAHDWDKEQIDQAALSLQEWGDNFMPPQAVQQDSKHDPSNPLPLRE